MKVQNNYICDCCQKKCDPRATYAVTISKIQTNGLTWHVENEYHVCPYCLRLVKLRIEDALEVVV